MCGNERFGCQRICGMYFMKEMSVSRCQFPVSASPSLPISLALSQATQTGVPSQCIDQSPPCQFLHKPRICGPLAAPQAGCGTTPGRVQAGSRPGPRCTAGLEPFGIATAPRHHRPFNGYAVTGPAGPEARRRAAWWRQCQLSALAPCGNYATGDSDDAKLAPESITAAALGLGHGRPCWDSDMTLDRLGL